MTIAVLVGPLALLSGAGPRMGALQENPSFERELRPPVLVRVTDGYGIFQRMEHSGVPGVSIAVIAGSRRPTSPPSWRVRRLKPPPPGVWTISRPLPSPCRPMPKTLTAFALTLAAFLPTPLSGQSMFDLLQALRDGGTWVGIPIEDGVGSVSTVTLPTLGMTLRGCGQVYGAHTGRWAIRARDSLGEGRLDVEVGPGEPVEFSYTTGAMSRLAVEVHWSEPRDTTLMVWIGLETRTPRRPDACVPVYGKGSGS